jgi:rifampicin phosphotransferase
MTETRKLVYFFGAGLAEADGKLVSIVGGKGAGLADMTLADLPVPPGFTISAECCREVLADPSDQWPAGLEQQVRRALHRLEELTGRRFGALDRPLLVAVRSGAAVSMPGMMDTVLNVGRHPHLPPWDELVECINAVFKSWNSRRAAAYRHRHSIDSLLGTAVTVQAMFPSQVAGVLFTQDPNDPAANRMIIEAGLGLGEAVVSGEVTPDRFLVARDAGGRVEFTPGRSSQQTPVLTSQQVAQLCQLALKVEVHFGRPMDIEWGLADGQLVLLQCRPIKGLDLAIAAQEIRRQEIIRLRGMAGSQHRIWVTHNLGETLRAPTPLTWDIVRYFVSGNGGFGLLYREMGFKPSKDVLEHGFLELICGRIYADPQRLAGLFWDGVPLTYDPQAILEDRSLLDRPPMKFVPEQADGRFLLRLPGVLASMVRSAGRMKRQRQRALAHFQRNVLPPYLEYVRSKRHRDLSRLSTADVIDELHQRRRRVLDEFGRESLKPGLFAGLAFGSLQHILVQLMGTAARQ